MNLLRLPGREYTGVSSFVYTTGAYSWQGRPVRESDRNRVPVAWHPKLIADYFGMTLEDFLADANMTIVTPAHMFGAGGTLVKKPRAVLLTESLIDPSFNLVTGPSFLAGLATDLAAMDVFVGRGVDYGIDNGGAIMTLPHEAETEVDDTTAVLGTHIHFFPEPTYANWRAGETLYVLGWYMAGATAGPFADSDITDGVDTVESMPNALSKFAEIVQGSYERHHRARWHVVFAQDDFADAYWDDNELSFRNVVQNLCDSLAAFGVTCTIINPFSTTLVETEVLAVVQEFWGL